MRGEVSVGWVLWHYSYQSVGLNDLSVDTG
jgi:hypothetical protein